jgi:hypothetical protein
MSLVNYRGPEGLFWNHHRCRIFIIIIIIIIFIIIAIE